jgi:hypothetical protein
MLLTLKVISTGKPRLSSGGFTFRQAFGLDDRGGNTTHGPLGGLALTIGESIGALALPLAVGEGAFVAIAINQQAKAIAIELVPRKGTGALAAVSPIAKRTPALPNPGDKFPFIAIAAGVDTGPESGQNIGHKPPFTFRPIGVEGNPRALAEIFLELTFVAIAIGKLTGSASGQLILLKTPLASGAIAVGKYAPPLALAIF